MAEEADRIYIDELAQLLDREVGTIRKWESQGKLPKHLLPKRGARGWRYWTLTQVHGARGIIAWMKRNDMRPGNLVTSPDREHEHVKNLRRPKFITKHHINSAVRLIKKGKGPDAIIKKIHPRTRYSSPANTERALRRVFRIDNIKPRFPNRDRGAPEPGLSLEQAAKLLKKS